MVSAQNAMCKMKLARYVLTEFEDLARLCVLLELLLIGLFLYTD